MTNFLAKVAQLSGDFLGYFEKHYCVKIAVAILRIKMVTLLVSEAALLDVNVRRSANKYGTF